MVSSLPDETIGPGESVLRAFDSTKYYFDAAAAHLQIEPELREALLMANGALRGLTSGSPAFATEV